MKKLFQNVKGTFEVIFFCLNISSKSSKKYFFISNLIALLTVFLPFISINFFSKIIQILSIGFGTNGVVDLNLFLFYVALFFGVSLGSKALNNVKQYTLFMLLMEANDDTDAARAAAGRAAEAGNPTRPLVAMLIGKIYVYPGDGADIQWKISAFAVSA